MTLKEDNETNTQNGKTAEDVALAVEDFVNSHYSIDLKNLALALGSMHKTLQQKFVGDVVIPLVRLMATRNRENFSKDPRNEFACRCCDAMLKGLEAEFPYIANGECRLPLI